jgi:hypothetical protein
MSEVTDQRPALCTIFAHDFVFLVVTSDTPGYTYHLMPIDP